MKSPCDHEQARGGRGPAVLDALHRLLAETNVLGERRLRLAGLLALFRDSPSEVAQVRHRRTFARLRPAKNRV